MDRQHSTVQYEYAQYLCEISLISDYIIQYKAFVIPFDYLIMQICLSSEN